MDKGAGKILVTGGGGFIGGHLVAEFIRQGYTDIRVVDCKPFTDWHQIFPQVENVSADLCELPACPAARLLWGRPIGGGDMRTSSG
jgi:nucleoside-diphosphate-sugar epimerase